MRDFTNGGDITVGGDFLITDQAQQHKLLIHCTSEELVADERFRHSQVARIRRGKIKHVAVALAVVACFAFVGGVYYWFNDQLEYFEFLAKTAGFILMLGSLGYVSMPTPVEQKHINALWEIQMLLRERGVR